MSSDVSSKDSREIVAQVLDELDRSHVVSESTDDLTDVPDLADSARGPRQSATERDAMLQQLPVE